MAFVFGEVSGAVGLVQHAPLSRGEVHGVLQALKYQVVAVRSVAMPAQGGQRQGVSGVIRQVELTFQAEFAVLRVPQARDAGGKQAIELAARGGLMMELSDARQVFEFFLAHHCTQSSDPSKTS
jgi:hypothetical protein